MAFGDTLTVTNTDDSGPGSLRQTILDATAGDTIAFGLPLPSTIILTSGELSIDMALTITGPAAASLTVKAAPSGIPPDPGFRVFDIGAGDLAVTITGITVTGGFLSALFAMMPVEGGGLLNQSTGDVQVQNCVVTGNFALLGGGISNHGMLALAGCTISGNGAGSDSDGFFPEGGGIFNDGTLTVNNGPISGNTASGPASHALAHGGGISNHGTLSLVNSTVTENGGVLNCGAGGIANFEGAMTLTNDTISGNFSDISIGGIVNFSLGTVQLRSTIIAGNMSLQFPPLMGADVGGTLTSEGYNLIGDGTNGTITPTVGDQIGTTTTPIDPKLGPLQNNGGSTETQALLPEARLLTKAALPRASRPISVDASVPWTILQSLRRMVEITATSAPSSYKRGRHSIYRRGCAS